MKPTAIQWLLKILEGQKDKPFDYDEWKIAFEHALQIEKEQIIEAYQTAEKDCGRDFLHGDLYYNETFKLKKQSYQDKMRDKINKAKSRIK
jgi:hypothetical protein